MKMISTIESIINNTINQTLLFQKSEFSLEEFDLLSQINPLHLKKYCLF